MVPSPALPASGCSATSEGVVNVREAGYSPEVLGTETDPGKLGLFLSWAQIILDFIAWRGLGE